MRHQVNFPKLLSTLPGFGAAAVTAFLFAAAVLANPVKPVVINGSAAFSQAANVLTVTNSNGAIIHWDGFSIGAGESTRFVQPSASSSVLNRVLNEPSAIYGSLSSNGRVWLVNPAGILVGPGGRIDTAGFVASTLGVSNQDFLAGRKLFQNTPGAGNVISRGEIRTPAGGGVYLIGSNVANEGVIVTPQGETILAAGVTVSLVDSASPGVRVAITGDQGNSTNLGEITAEAGRVGIAGVIVRHSGSINASSVVHRGGRVFLVASQDAHVAGNSRVAVGGIRGGSVQVLGNRVAVSDDASVDASSLRGGGEILVGGDRQGRNPAVRNAAFAYLGPRASLKADATGSGDGGKIVVWADDTTRAWGSISARGGAKGGNGGFVETSGKRHLDVNGIAVDTRAAAGRTGTWLLDPTNIYIAVDQATATAAGMSAADISVNSTGPALFQTGGSPVDSLLQTATLQGALGVNNVEVNTVSIGSGAGHIFVTSPVSWANANTLKLNATGNVGVNADITGTSGRLSLLAGGGIQRGGAATIKVDKLEAIAGAGVNLPGSNEVRTFAASAAGGPILLETREAGGLIIGTVGGTSGLSALGSIDIRQQVAGGINVNQSLSSSNAAIGLNAANQLVLNSAVTTTTSPPGIVKLLAGVGGINGSAAGIVTGDGLEIISGGGVNLTSAPHSIGTLAGSVTGAGFSFVNSRSYSVGTVNTAGLTVAGGDISLATTGATTLLTVLNNVQATSGSVSYIADNLAHNATTTTSSSAGKFVEIRPVTASTQIEFVAAATPDAAGFLRLSSAELTGFATPMLKVGNSSQSAGIAINQAVSPSGFATLSLITGGAISQTAPISITNLNADGFAGVALTQNNDVANIAGRSNTGNFAFTDANSFNISQVDVANNGIILNSSGTINLIAGSGGAITQSAGAILSVPAGSLSAVADTGIALTTSGNSVSGLVNLNNTGAGNISYIGSGNVSLGTVSTAAGAVNVISSSGQIQDGNAAANNISGTSVSLSAATGIGSSAGLLGVDATTLVNAQTSAGSIHLSSPTSMKVANISAAGQVQLLAGTSIVDANAAAGNILASSANLSALSGIGSGDALETQVATLAATNSSANSIEIDNKGILTIAGINNAASSGGAIVVDNLGGITTTGGISSAVGNVTLTAHSPLTVGAGISAANITLNAGGPVWVAGKTGDDLTINGALTLTGPGTIRLNAGNTIGGSQIPVSGGGRTVLAVPQQNNPAAGPAPTLAQCIATPLAAGCAAVLPTLATCSSAPNTAGCSVVLPSLASCIATPSAPGCSVVLPTITTCTANPGAAGCTVVLPALASCVAAPSLPGCSAVLPTIAACSANPATAGCSVVLPSLAACVADATQPGCAAVLPSIASCSVHPAGVGCAAVLPSLASCTANPSLAGCTTVLPSLATCTGDPARTGCSAVLPRPANSAATNDVITATEGAKSPARDSSLPVSPAGSTTLARLGSADPGSGAGQGHFGEESPVAGGGSAGGSSGGGAGPGGGDSASSGSDSTSAGKTDDKADDKKEKKDARKSAEAKSEKKDDKPVARKIAQCS